MFHSGTKIQAEAVWQWSNFLHARVGASKQPLRVNIDETGIRLRNFNASGLLTAEAVCLRRANQSLHGFATRGDTRMMFTLLTFVCDDEEIQKVLPQIIIFGVKTATAAEVERFKALLPPSVLLWVCEKAWMTSSTFISAMHTLHSVLEAYLHTRQVIVSADVYKAHLTREVVRTLSRCFFFLYLAK